MNVTGCYVCEFCGEQFWGRDGEDNYYLHKSQCKPNFIKRYKEKHNFSKVNHKICAICKFFHPLETGAKGVCGGNFDGVYDWQVKMYETDANCVCDRFEQR